MRHLNYSYDSNEIFTKDLGLSNFWRDILLNRERGRGERERVTDDAALSVWCKFLICLCLF